MDKRAWLNKADNISSAVHLKLFGEKPGLSAFLFHSIFTSSREIEKNHILPQERMTVEKFREFLDYFLSNNYRFVTPDEIHSTLPDEHARYGLITFDDGYFNNILIADVLAEYKVPAVFFYSTAYIMEGKKFWSDVLYHERRRKGISHETVFREIISLKNLKTAAVEAYVVEQFGESVMRPIGDIDRPMTPDEFARFAKNPWVHIGNHTHQHEILTNLTEEEVNEEFSISQKILAQITGATPWFVSYPNGSYSENIINLAMKNGLDTGITTIQQKNRLQLNNRHAGQLLLHRFNPAVDEQGAVNFKNLRSSFQMKTQIKKWLQ